jgi:large subunit ribosomal protein L21
MYAVIQTGGKQYKVSTGDVIRVELLALDEGATVDFDALMIGDGESCTIGTPTVAGSKVTATVTAHGRGDKVRIVKFRRRKNSRRQMGHRQYYTELQVSNISG